MMIKRVPSGITGLDNLIQGGFPDGFCILVSGPPGAGKTIFTLQFLMESARRGEAGVYITLDQRIKDLRNQAKQFGWNFHEYEMGRFVRFMRPSKGSAWNQNIAETIKGSRIHHEILPVIRDSIAEIDAKRLVIDSLSTLTLSLPRGFDDGEIRLFLKRLVDEVKSLGVTSIVTSDLPKNSNWLSRDRVSEFVCDGVIVLDDVVFGEDPVRILRIPKMRETEQDRKAHFFKITGDGIVVEV